jgi:hypothetical protein
MQILPKNFFVLLNFDASSDLKTLLRITTYTTNVAAFQTEISA